MEPVRDDSKTAAEAQAAQAGDSGDYLVFAIDGCRYALPVGDVREVLPAVEVDHLPGDTDELLGVITLRGHMVPVADARRFLGAEPRPVGVRDHFLVTERSGRAMVFPCDRVVGIERLARDADDTTQELMRDGGRVAWVVRDAEGLILVPDLTGCLPRSDAA